MDAIDYALSEFERTEPGHSNDIVEARRLLTALRKELATEKAITDDYFRRQELLVADACALRKENARKDEAIARALRDMARIDELCDMAGVHRFAQMRTELAALASARPAPAQKQGEESVAETIAEAVHDYICESISDFDGASYSRWELEDVVSRALLARKPAEGRRAKARSLDGLHMIFPDEIEARPDYHAEDIEARIRSEG